MSTLQAAVGTGHAETIGGTDVQFPRITVYDLAEADRARRQQLKADAEANAKGSELSPVDLYNVKMDIDSREMSIQQHLDSAMTPAGAAKFLERSLAKAGRSPADARSVIEQMDPDRCVTVAQTLILFDQVRKLKGEEVRGKNAGEGAVFGTTPVTVTDASPAPTTSTPTPPPTDAVKNKEPKGFGD